MCGERSGIRLRIATMPDLTLRVDRLQVEVVLRSLERLDVNAPAASDHHFLSCWQATPGCESQFLARLNWLSGKSCHC